MASTKSIRRTREEEDALSNSSSDEGEIELSGSESPAQPEPETFAELGLSGPLVKACTRLGWKKPTSIQAQAVPWGLQKRDVIGVAQTGSGKTAAFALPILEALLQEPQGLFALCLAPTRFVLLLPSEHLILLFEPNLTFFRHSELAIQIAEQFDALGGSFGVTTCTVVGGVGTHPTLGI